MKKIILSILALVVIAVLSSTPYLNASVFSEDSQHNLNSIAQDYDISCELYSNEKSIFYIDDVIVLQGTLLPNGGYYCYNDCSTVPCCFIRTSDPGQSP